MPFAFRIRKINLKENGIWDDLIKSSPQGNTFLLSYFLLAWEDNDSEIHLHRVGCFDSQNNLVGGQAFLHKKKAGFFNAQALLQTWSHIETPVVAHEVTQGSEVYFGIMTALANEASRMFLYYKVFCHPSIWDIRPFLYSGWRAKPDYSHGWDLQDADTLLNDLKAKKRFKQAERTVNNFNFAEEVDASIIDEFLDLYHQTARSIGFRLRESFDNMFRSMAREMLNRKVIRFYTCRKLNGELAGVATYVLSHNQKMAYGWQLAHIPLKGEKDFVSALYLYAIKSLSKEIKFIDIAEGIQQTLYYFKDSLGTKSSVHFVVETPNAKRWTTVIETVRRVKYKLLNFSK